MKNTCLWLGGEERGGVDETNSEKPAATQDGP